VEAHQERRRAEERFEAETQEIPAVTDEELEQLRRRKQQSTEAACTDPAYVAFLERQLAEATAAIATATSAAESARAVFHAVGAHNAELTEQVRELTEMVIRLQAELLSGRRG
jgi:hypothetical protein